MKLYLIMFLCLSFIYASTNAQQLSIFSKATEVKDTGPPVDTTDFFPLQIGNYWEYAAFTADGYVYFSIAVIGDTIMPNGKNYKIFAEKYFYNPNYYSYIWFFRKDSGNAYRYYGGDSTQCDKGEDKYFDFSLSDSSVWKVCAGSCGNARGITKTYNDDTYYSYFKKSLETKVFLNVQIDSADTIWAPCVDGSIPIWIAKGIGIVRELRFNDGDYWLQGAIINGVKFGTITDVSNKRITTPFNFKIEAYPNPFNSTVTLNVSLPTSGLISVSIYNILGQKIKAIFENYKSAGNYSLKYNADNLNSGVYFILLKQNQMITTQKIILLK